MDKMNFTGEIPNAFASLTELTVMSMASNPTERLDPGVPRGS